MTRPFVLTYKESNIEFDSIILKVIINKNLENNKDRYIQVLLKGQESEYSEGYKAYIFEDETVSIESEQLIIKGVEYLNTLENNDVIEIEKIIRVLYRDASDDNILLVTNQCNSNCIMCPDSEYVRNVRNDIDVGRIKRIINEIPDDVQSISITGGEPTMAKDGLIEVLKECKEKLPYTFFQLLTNGRSFSDREYTKRIAEVIPSNHRLGIPLYGISPAKHDAITRAPGSFEQTKIGIRNLLDYNIKIEIRIVVTKLNYKNLIELSEYIASQYADKIEMVNIMSLEMSGNALKNKEFIWVDYDEMKNYVFEASINLIKHGIDVNLYNFPLCKIDPRLHYIAAKSISDYKINYKEECRECSIKDICGGFFESTLKTMNPNVNPVGE